MLAGLTLCLNLIYSCKQGVFRGSRCGMLIGYKYFYIFSPEA